MTNANPTKKKPALPPSKTQHELNLDFLLRLHRLQPASIRELNEGLLPEWQADAARRLLASGEVAECGRDAAHDAPRLVVTEAGRQTLEEFGLVRPASPAPRQPYGRPIPARDFRVPPRRRVG